MRKKYALQKGGDKRLELSWKARWKRFTVKFDDQEVGVIPSRAELLEGRDFDLPDGSRLRVQLKFIFLPMLALYRNDEPLPGTDADPHKRLRRACTTIFVLAGISLLFGAIIEIASIRAFQKEGFGVALLIVGFVWFVLGLLVRRRSMIALAIAVILLLVDLVGSGYIIGQTENGLVSLGFLIKIAMLLWMSAAFSAIRELKEGVNK